MAASTKPKPKTKSISKAVAQPPKRRMSKRRLALIIAGALGGLLVLVICYFCLYDPRYSGPVQTGGDIKIFAHRGYGDHGPDNSLAASTRSLDELQISGVDVDAQLTRDGKLVVFHDLSLDRLTDKQGKVSSLSLAELEALDLAKKYEGTGYEQAPIESFETFVQTITPRATLMVEMKIIGTGDTGAEREAYRILQQYDAFDRVILSSFNPLVLRRLESLDHRIQTMFIFMDTNWNAELLAEMNPKDVVNLPWFLRNETTRKAVRKIIKPDYLSVNVEVAEATRTRLIAQGWPVFLWAPNDAASIQKAIDQRPYGIISDEPAEVLKLLMAGRQ